MKRIGMTLHRMAAIGLCLALFASSVRAVLQDPRAASEKGVVAVFQEGRRLFFRGEFEAAQPKFREAFLISQQRPGGPDIVSLKYEGLCFQYQDELDQALDIFREALQVQERYNSAPRQWADTLINIGWALYLKGDYPQALEHLKRAEVAIEKAEPDKPGKGPPWLPGTIMTNLGAVYTALGNYSMAFKYLRHVVEQSVNFNDKMNQSRALQYLGNLERSWGNVSKALECYEQAVNVGREAYDQPYNRAYLVESLNDLGALFGQQAMYDRAQKAFREALDISHQLGTRWLIARSLINLGNLARDQGELELAVGYHRQALSLSEEAALRPIVGLALAELGWDSLQMGRAEQAIDVFQRALDAGGDTLSPDVKTSIYSGLAEAYKMRGDWDKAKEYDRRTIESIERVRLEALSEDRKIGFWQTKQAAFERAISLLHRLHQKDSQAGYDAQAFAYAERARARAFLDLLAEARVHIRRGLSPDALKEERAIFRGIGKIRKKLLRGGLSKTGTAKLEQDLAIAEGRLREFQQRLRLTRPAYAALQYPEPIDLQKAQREVLDSKTLLIEYLLGEKASLLWAISKKGCQMVALPGREEIERRVSRYRQVMTISYPDKEAFDRYFYRALRLYNLLLKPVEKTLNQYDHLIIVPDGGLHYLPFETLIERRVTKETIHPRFLLSSHRISYASSASALGLVRATSDESGKKEKELLAYADPVFTRRQLVAQGKKGQVKLVNMTRSLYRQRGMNLEPLPYTRREVRGIARLFPPGAARVYLGEAATESSVKRERLAAFRCLHFATHGLIDEGVPARSGIVFSLVRERGEDGILQMNEIFNLNLDANLVVLSACQSGLGKLVRGEGLIGLTRAFLYAGASSVVVSLWDVPDVSTAEFMKQFYRHLRTGKGKAEALRQAKLDMIRSDTLAYRFPYFWAPFVIIGQAH